MHITLLTSTLDPSVGTFFIIFCYIASYFCVIFLKLRRRLIFPQYLLVIRMLKLSKIHLKLAIKIKLSSVASIYCTNSATAKAVVAKWSLYCCPVTAYKD